MEDAINLEAGVMPIEERAKKPWANLRLLATNILVQYSTAVTDSWKPNFFRFKKGKTDFFISNEYSLEPSYIETLKTVAICKGGIVGAQGPPGTGKTTLVTKIAALIYQQCELPFGRIALTAHSNQAVRALLEKMVDVLPRLFGIELSRVCWVESEKGRERRLQSDIVVDPLMERLSLEARRNQIARAAPKRYPLYNRYGFAPADPAEKKVWYKERKAIDKIIKSWCVFFVSTISAINIGFFRPKGDELRERFCVDVLIIDEVT